MGAGKGKTVSLNYLIPNPDLVKDRLITQVHDYNDYVDNINAKRFADYQEGEVKWIPPNSSFSAGKIERIMDANINKTARILANTDDTGRKIYEESLNAFHQLNKMSPEIQVNQISMGDVGAGMAYYSVDTHTIRVDKSMLSGDMFEDYNEYCYNTGSTPTDSIIHEYGHAVYYRIEEQFGDKIKQFHKKTSGMEAVSRYGNMDEHEAFAESFNLYVTGRQPVQGKEYHKEFEKFMKDVGMTKFKKAMPSKKNEDALFKTFDEYVKNRHKFKDADIATFDKVFVKKELDKMKSSKAKQYVEVSYDDIEGYIRDNKISYNTYTFLNGSIMLDDEKTKNSYDPTRKYKLPVMTEQMYNEVQSASSGNSKASDRDLYNKYYNPKTNSMDMQKASQNEDSDTYFKIAKWNKKLMNGEDPFPKATAPKKMSKVKMKILAGELDEEGNIVEPKKKTTKKKETPKPTPPKEPAKPVDRMADLVAKYSKYKTTSTLTRDFNSGKITQAEYNHILNALGKNTKSVKESKPVATPKVTPAPKVETPKATENKVKKETKKSTVTPTKEQKKPTTTKKVEPKKKKSNVKNTYSNMSTEDFNNAIDDLLNKYK